MLCMKEFGNMAKNTVTIDESMSYVSFLLRCSKNTAVSITVEHAYHNNVLCEFLDALQVIYRCFEHCNALESLQECWL